MPISTARPVWCSLKPGGADTQRMSSIFCPAVNLRRMISTWRSMLLNAETINMRIASPCAADLNRFHASAAAGMSKCSLPSWPTSATSSSVASEHGVRPRAVSRAGEMPSASSSAACCMFRLTTPNSLIACFGGLDNKGWRGLFFSYMSPGKRNNPGHGGHIPLDDEEVTHASPPRPRGPRLPPEGNPASGSGS